MSLLLKLFVYFGFLYLSTLVLIFSSGEPFGELREMRYL